MLRFFFEWWAGQLAELLPRRLRRAAAGAGDALVISPVGGLGRGIEIVAAGLRRNGKETRLGRCAVAGPALRGLPRAPGGACVLRLDPVDVLTKSVRLPLAAQAELGQVLAFEMDRETPFAAEDVYWTHRLLAVERDSGQIVVRLSLVPKVSLAPLLAALAEAGLAPQRADIADGSEGSFYLPLDGNGSRRSQASRRLLRPLAAAFAVLAVVAVATPFLRQALTLRRLDRRVAAARLQAEEAAHLRQAITRLSAGPQLIASERRKAARPLEVLAAATRVLPDNTYLSEFDLRGERVTMSGRSQAAAPLLGALAASGAFRNPVFAAPVTRLEALHTEVFTIVAEVVP